MTTEQYVNDILFSLGYPIVEIEIKDYIPKIVDMAFREIKHYISDTRTITVPYNNKIHLSDPKKYPIDSVVYIMRGQSQMTDADLQDVMYMMMNSSSLQTSTLTNYSVALLTQQCKNTIATDLDFHWDKENRDLYVYANYPKPSSVTIVYIPEYHVIEDIREPFWENLLKRLALALSKQMLGRIRSKYKSNSATYELDGDTLLSEAQAEITEIRQFLDDNNDLLLPID